MPRGGLGPELVDVHPPRPVEIRWECEAGNVVVTAAGVCILPARSNRGGGVGFSVSEFQKLRRIVDTARAVYENGTPVTSPRQAEGEF